VDAENPDGLRPPKMPRMEEVMAQAHRSRLPMNEGPDRDSLLACRVRSCDRESCTSCYYVGIQILLLRNIYIHPDSALVLTAGQGTTGRGGGTVLHPGSPRSSVGHSLLQRPRLSIMTWGHCQQKGASSIGLAIVSGLHHGAGRAYRTDSVPEFGD